MYERHEYKKHEKELREQQEINGPNRTANGADL